MKTKSHSLSVPAIIALALFILPGERTVDSQTSPTARSSSESAVETNRKCRQSKRSSTRKRVSSALCGSPVSNTAIRGVASSNIVEARVSVDENGKIVSVRPVSGKPEFYEKAMKAINEMKFTPKVRSGRAVKSELVVRVVVDGSSK